MPAFPLTFPVVVPMTPSLPRFPGESGVDQLVEIIKVLGTPTRVQIEAMNPNYTDFRFPQIKARPWNKVFRARTPEDAIDLCSMLLEYTPVKRIELFPAMAHPFFDELRDPACNFGGRPLPELFNWTPEELATPCGADVIAKLQPAHTL